MNLFYPLKKLSELDTNEVGFYAKEYSKLNGVVNLPFSLVVSSQIFSQFIEFNNFSELISKKPTGKKEQVEFFAQISESFSKAKFPQRINEELKECFELVTLDTTNLSSLADIGSKRSIIQIKRSTTYEDFNCNSPNIIYSKDDFILFLDLIKNLFAGLFTPSAINYRIKHDINKFSSAVVISRLPEMFQCFNSEFSKGNILVKSYIGFLDFEGKIIKDRFEVNGDFLKIEAANIQKQETVCVFNLEINKPQIKAFTSTSASSQSATDNEILEIGRLIKRIAKELNKNEFSLQATKAKNSQPVIIDLDLSLQKENFYLENKSLEDDKTKTSFENEPFVKEKLSNNNLEDLELENILKNNSSKEPNSSGFEFEVEDDFNSKSTKMFIEQIKNFLTTHKNNKLKSNIDLVLRSLDNEISKESVSSALQICEEIIRNI